MEKSLEATGRTADEAIQIGLEELGVSRADADVVVLSSGRQGILGLGAEQARVRITIRSEESPPVASGDDADQARDILQELLRLMDVDAEIEVYLPGSDPEIESSPGDPIVLDIQGEDAGLLIGRRGATLHDLQSLVTTIVSRTLQHYVPLRVDVEGYQQRRLDQVRQVAERAADHVRRRRRSLTLEPMSPAERRIVHTTLADNPAVQTQSTGQGDGRRVTISLVSGGGRGQRQDDAGDGRGRAQAARASEPPPPPVVDEDEDEFEEYDDEDEFEDDDEYDDEPDKDDEDDEDDDADDEDDEDDDDEFDDDEDEYEDDDEFEDDEDDEDADDEEDDR